MAPSAEPCRDPQAVIHALYVDHRPLVLAYVTRILSDHHQAEDIVQETMLRAWRHSHSLVTNEGSIRGWLMRVAHNITVDRIRARNARPTEVDEAAAPVGACEDHAAMVVDSVFVSAALARLTPAQRDVIREVYLADRTVADAASVLGLPLGTAKSRVHHGLRQLRRHVEKPTE
jgi:RNA polymerase sigma-70 factor, ECF subfamily